MPWFGSQSSDSTKTSLPEDVIRGHTRTCTEFGTATSITFRIEQDDGTPPIKFAIYDSSNKQLVGYTEEGEVTNGYNDWMSLDIVDGGYLSSNHDYLLCHWFGATADDVFFYYEDGTNTEEYQDTETYDGNFSDPLGIAASPTDEWDIGYCTYDSYTGSWLNIGSSHIHSKCGEEAGGTLANALDGSDAWDHDTNHTHWFILDLGKSYTVYRVRSRSLDTDDPEKVNIYVSDDTGSFGDPVKGEIDKFQDTAEWKVVPVSAQSGRYVKVEVTDTEDVSDALEWGSTASPFKIFDVFGKLSLTYSIFNTSVGSPTTWLWNSGQYDVASGMRATSATPTTWDWGPISANSSYFYPSGSPTSWKWVSGNAYT